ncbi:OmpA family protein [Alteromonas halophila]|uniref:OmpA-like domain-containing protein n=1 Tax=Alteromonas halophila TaxID=516698 RepID=A0A918JHU2_9ALTE|nr:OmpA family protein [Alteromonas halophila]GGW81599.1 hypothetical protein GCM10007391_13520 [Alteromonas halophila]
MKSARDLDDEEQLRAVRNIVLGQEREHVLSAIESHARDIVGAVVVEALHDRQKQNDDLSTVFVPLVEKSVEKSVTRHSDQFIGYFYPVVGKLVRKSVAAFLSDVLEKTNTLLENSLSVKGLVWRIKARQAGVSFSQYVAAQTFAYQVEQVFLIDANTGILLNSVARENHSHADADMVSGMLTAINDFVGDSFAHTNNQEEQQLASVKTDDFTLLLQRGPSLVLVAAVTGQAPAQVSQHLQITTENIHRLYAREIEHFNGDTSPFERTTSELRECLVEQLNTPDKKRRPWFAIIVLGAIVLAFIFWLYHTFEQSQLKQQLAMLDSSPGILVRSVTAEGLTDVSLQVLRDPDSQPVSDWLAQQGIRDDRVLVEEKPYLSLERPLVERRIARVVARYPAISLTPGPAGFNLEGQLNRTQLQRLTNELAAIPGVSDAAALTARLDLIQAPTPDRQQSLKAMFDFHAAKIDATQIEFDAGNSDLSERAVSRLTTLNQQLDTAVRLARQLQLSVGLMIMGASDASGSTSFNQQLSQARAQAVRDFLVSQGADPDYLNAVGLGVVEIDAIDGVGARKVMFNLMDFTPEARKEERP